MKIKDILNTASVKSLHASAEVKFKDAAPGLVVGSALIAQDPEKLERKYPELAYLNSGITASNVGGYQEFVRTLRLSGEGSFKTAGDSSQNTGQISLNADSSIIRIIRRTAKSSWSDTEVKQAMLEDLNIISEYTSEHYKTCQFDIDNIMAFGIEGGAKGLLNNTFYAAEVASNTADNLAEISGEALYNEIVKHITAQFELVQDTPEYMVDTMVTTVRVYNLLAKTILNAAAGPATVLKALKENFPEMTFKRSARNAEIADNPTVFYSTNSQAIKLRVPQPLSFAPISQVGFDFMSASEYRVGGVDILEPTSGVIVTGL